MKEEYQKNFGQEKIHHQQSFATEFRISKQLYLRSFDVMVISLRWKQKAKFRVN